MELEPRKAGAWSYKGAILKYLGRYEEAISCFDKALELNPQDWVSQDDRSDSLRRLGRYDGMRFGAILGHDKVRKLAPRDAMACYAEALAQEGLGRIPDAVRSYKRFIALAPTQYAWLVELAQQRVRELEGR